MLVSQIPLLLIWAAAAQQAAAAQTLYTRQQDVIYGRKDGTALTMDVITPKQNRNGAALLWMVSGGWFSSHDSITDQSIQGFTGPLLKRGYTIIAVVHGSQPRYTIPDAIADVNRASRYVHAHAAEYGIDASRLGVFGGSAGGHLSLMLGLAPQPADPKNPDLINRMPANVQAVAAWFPPTDFFNYGKDGNVNMGTGVLAPFRAPFEFKELDEKTKTIILITDPTKIDAIGHAISPVYHVSKDDPPVLLLHGDADTLVPIQQSHILVEKLTAAGVPVKLLTRKGMGHGWPRLHEDVNELVTFFDQQLLKKTTTSPATTQATQPAPAG